MKKSLKFSHGLVEHAKKMNPLITPRIFDDKELAVGDEIELLDSETGEVFGSKKIERIKEMTFAEMVKDAANIEGMYEMYQEYYKQKISPEESVKMIFFEKE